MKTYQDVLNETDFSKFSNEELEGMGRDLAMLILQTFSMVVYHDKNLMVYDYRKNEQSDISRFGMVLVTGIHDKDSLEDRIHYMDNLKDFVIYVGTLTYRGERSVKKRFIDSVKTAVHNNNLKKRYGG